MTWPVVVNVTPVTPLECSVKVTKQKPLRVFHTLTYSRSIREPSTQSPQTLSMQPHTQAQWLYQVTSREATCPPKVETEGT